MENKKELLKGQEKIHSEETAKNLNKDQLESTSGGIGLGLATAIGTYRAIKKGREIRSKHGEPQNGLNSIATRIKPYARPYIDNPRLRPNFILPAIKTANIENSAPKQNSNQTADELINKIYNANQEYMQRKPYGQADDIDDVEKVLKV